MKKIVFFVTLAMALMLVPLWGQQAFAALYDDFTSGTIDTTNKWTVTYYHTDISSVVPANSSFGTQPYMLQLSGPSYDPYGNRTGLNTVSTFSGDLKAGINFLNYSSWMPTTNISPSAPGLGLRIGVNNSTAAGAGGDFWSIIRTTNNNNNWISSFHYYGDAIHDMNSTLLDITSGGLLLSYNSVSQKLNFSYSTSTNPNDWSTGGTQLYEYTGVTFGSDPHLLVGAFTGAGNGTGSFIADVGGLYYDGTESVPEPSTLAVLGLVGAYFGFQRRKKINTQNKSI